MAANQMDVYHDWFRKHFGIDPDRFTEKGAFIAKFATSEKMVKMIINTSPASVAAQTYRGQIAEIFSFIDNESKAGHFALAFAKLDECDKLVDQFLEEQQAHGGRSFDDSFHSCMNTLGLPAPSGLFGTATQVVAFAATIEKLVAVYGVGSGAVTISELVVAGSVSDKLAVAGACLASAYAGACSGCAIRATADATGNAYDKFKLDFQF